MKGEPALVVGLVDAGSVLHQESHHVDVVVDARLRRETGEMGCKNGGAELPGRTRAHEPTAVRFLVL